MIYDGSRIHIHKYRGLFRVVVNLSPMSNEISRGCYIEKKFDTIQEVAIFVTEILLEDAEEKSRAEES